MRQLRHKEVKQLAQRPKEHAALNSQSSSGIHAPKHCGVNKGPRTTQTSQAGAGDPAPWAFYTGNHSSKSKDLKGSRGESCGIAGKTVPEKERQGQAEFPRNKEGPMGAVVQG